MSIVQPTYDDYKDSAGKIKNWLASRDLEYVIYGSFNNPNKIRPGLSDIDFLVYKEDNSLLFPLEIIEAF